MNAINPVFDASGHVRDETIRRFLRPMPMAIGGARRMPVGAPEVDPAGAVRVVGVCLRVPCRRSVG